MRTVFTICSFLALWLVFSMPLKAQEKETALDGFVRYGLENNLVLKQKKHHSGTSSAGTQNGQRNVLTLHHLTWKFHQRYWRKKHIVSSR